MPVLITIATVNALFRPGSEQVSFLDPDALRDRCRDELEDTETRARAMILVEQLQQLARQYEKAVVASVDAYITESVKWESSASGLIEQLQPWDSARLHTVQEIVRIRQSMRELLTTEQWERVFG
jgi:hypothetical protein